MHMHCCEKSFFCETSSYLKCTKTTQEIVRRITCVLQIIAFSDSYLIWWHTCSLRPTESVLGDYIDQLFVGLQFRYRHGSLIWRNCLLLVKPCCRRILNMFPESNKCGILLLFSLEWLLMLIKLNQIQCEPNDFLILQTKRRETCTQIASSWKNLWILSGRILYRIKTRW